MYLPFLFHDWRCTVFPSGSLCIPPTPPKAGEAPHSLFCAPNVAGVLAAMTISITLKLPSTLGGGLVSHSQAPGIEGTYSNVNWLSEWTKWVREGGWEIKHGYCTLPVARNNLYLCVVHLSISCFKFCKELFKRRSNLVITTTLLQVRTIFSFTREERWWSERLNALLKSMGKWKNGIKTPSSSILSLHLHWPSFWSLWHDTQLTSKGEPASLDLC